MLDINLFLPGALFFDTLIGDPRVNWHPVALIGRLIVFLEKRLLKADGRPAEQKKAGFLLLILVAGLIYLLCVVLTKVLYALGGWAGLTGSTLMLSLAITPRALRRAAREIYLSLRAGDIDAARRQTGLIVGRDTGRLDEGEITRAAVETVAENITDGIVAPLFYAALGGAPLAFAYRAVNTLDSMVGYKNDRYFHFGWASARFDDVCNYIPARLSAVMILLAAAFLPGCSLGGAARALWRDAAKHPSPNSGYAEAPVAGALGVRLGGCNYYFGRPSWRAYLGEARKPLAARHIKQTVTIMYFVTVCFTAVLTLLLNLKYLIC